MEDEPCDDGRTGRICGNRKGEKPCPIWSLNKYDAGFISQHTVNFITIRRLCSKDKVAFR
jgi:hypothetical protein